MQHIRFGLGFLLVTVIGWTMYVALFVLQLGARTGAEYWMYDAEIVKHHLANAQAKKNKVLFLGGSSVWFGIDTGLVQETLGIETINLGLHAMRPLDRILNEVRPVLRPGDTIIMPLEFEFYMIDTPYNEWYVNEIMAGEPELFWTWNWPEKISFFFSVPPMRVFEGVTTRLFANRVANINQRIPGHPPEQVIASIQETWAKGALPEENYTFRNINHHGDAIVTRGSFSSYVYPISGEEVARDYPWKTLASFAQYCTARSIPIFVSWPPVVNGEVAFDSRLIQSKVRVIVQKLGALGIPVLGQPADFQYDRHFFTDSGYHLNREGRTLHTRHMLRLINMERDNRVCGQNRGACQRPEKKETPALATR